MLELFPDVLWFQAEHMADRHKGEQPARVSAEKPILSFAPALNMPGIRLKLLMKAEKSIFEHSVHQRCLRTDEGEIDPRIKQLFRKHAGAGCALIRGGTAGGHRLA